MKRNKFLEILQIFIGQCLISFAFMCFLLPNRLVTGGISGISVILNYMFAWDASFLNLCMNIPLLIACFIFLGKGVFVRTVLAGILAPLTMWMFSTIPAITNDPLLASVFGAIVTGIGLGIIFRTNSSAAGTGIPAQIANKLSGISIGTALMIIDGAIVLASLIVFDIETMLYSIISLYITVKLTDYIMVGGSTSVALQIVSEKDEVIKKEIYEKIDRGVTRIVINSNFNPAIKHMLLCVIPAKQFITCKRLVLSIDENAFILVYDAHEVSGRGFTSSKEYGFMDALD